MHCTPPSIIVITCYFTNGIVSPLVRVDGDAEEARVGLQDKRGYKLKTIGVYSIFSIS